MIGFSIDTTVSVLLKTTTGVQYASTAVCAFHMKCGRHAGWPLYGCFIRLRTGTAHQPASPRSCPSPAHSPHWLTHTLHPHLPRVLVILRVEALSKGLVVGDLRRGPKQKAKARVVLPARRRAASPRGGVRFRQGPSSSGSGPPVIGACLLGGDAIATRCVRKALSEAFALPGHGSTGVLPLVVALLRSIQRCGISCSTGLAAALALLNGALGILSRHLPVMIRTGSGPGLGRLACPQPNLRDPHPPHPRLSSK